MAADPTSLLSDLLNAIKVRTDAAQKLADAVANQTKVSQEAARITKEANVALQTATTAQSSAHKALADAARGARRHAGNADARARDGVEDPAATRRVGRSQGRIDRARARRSPDGMSLAAGARACILPA